MTLKIAKMNSGDVLNAYDIDVGQLFDAFAGLEQGTKSLGGLTITPAVDSTGVFKITKADGSILFSVDTVNGLIGLGVDVSLY